mgnify:FL=1
MTPLEYYIYVVAHVVFLVMGIAIISGSCSRPIPWTAAPESFWGMKFISEEIMTCKYTDTPWQYLPQMVSIPLSLIYIQIYHTYRILSVEHGVSWGSTVLVVVLPMSVHGLLVLASNDYRTSYQTREDNVNYHFYGVCVFITGFWIAHLFVCISYARHKATINGVYYAKMRRLTYFCIEGLYFFSTIAFALMTMGNWRHHAIGVEYVLLILLVSMNLYSLYILSRFV